MGYCEDERMYIICLASGGYSEDGSLKKIEKEKAQRQETPASLVIRFIARKF